MYDRLSIGAVLAEWMKTIAELPLIVKRAVEMGLISSAQLVRFFSMDVRPNITRMVSRTLPPQVSHRGESGWLGLPSLYTNAHQALGHCTQTHCKKNWWPTPPASEFAYKPGPATLSIHFGQWSLAEMHRCHWPR